MRRLSDKMRSAIEERHSNYFSEIALIGAMLVDGSIIPHVMKTVHPSHMMLSANQITYHQIAIISRNKEPVDLITTHAHLSRRGLIGDEEGKVCSAWLTACIEQCPSSANWRAYAKHVTDSAQDRALRCLSDEMPVLMDKNSIRYDVTTSMFIDTMRQAVQRIGEMSNAKPRPDLQTILENILKENKKDASNDVEVGAD